MKRIALLLVLLLIVGGAAYLYFPRGGGLSAAVAATLAVLNADLEAQKGNTPFAPALDGDLLATGDVVRSSADGRGVLTFFDGSTVTVETGGTVKVTTLNRLDGGGIQAAIEQTLGRSWSSIEKLKTPDSKFEVRTPTSVATVRGTAFETIVERRADGTVTVTYKTYEGELLVTANAGGQVVVPANTQVSIAQNQPAPATPTPIPPGPALRLTASSGLGFVVTAPTGASCGSAGNPAQIPRCVLNGNVVTIHEPVAGRYIVLLTAAAAVQNATLRAEALEGATVRGGRTLARSLALGDLVRSAFVYGPQGVGEFEAAEGVASICAAQASGRVFASGTLAERWAALQAFVKAQPGAEGSFVATDAELTQAAAEAAAQGGGADLPASVSDVTVKVGRDGLRLAGNVATPIGTFASRADVLAGAVGRKLVLRLRDLSAGPLPSALLDQVRTAIDARLNEFSSTFPLAVRRVALRPGCLSITGTAP